MAEAFRQGLDAHTYTAELLFGDSTDINRQRAKIVNFSILFQGGASTIVRQFASSGTVISFKEARDIISLVKQKMQGVEHLLEVISQEVDSKGYVRSLYGRHLHPDPKKDIKWAKRKLLNALCQGSAGDLMRDAIVKVHEHLKEYNYKSHITNSVHDELTLDCSKQEVRNLVDTVPQLMINKTVHPIVPIETSVEYSELSWADKEDYWASTTNSLTDYVANTTFPL
jgi:DNA polymerase-1